MVTEVKVELAGTPAPTIPEIRESDELQLCPGPTPHIPHTQTTQQAGQCGELFIIRGSLGYRIREGRVQRGRTIGRRARGVQTANLDGSGKAHPVIAHVEDGIVRPEEDISKDPHGLATLRGQRAALKAHHADTILLFKGGTAFTHLLMSGLPLNDTNTSPKGS